MFVFHVQPDKVILFTNEPNQFKVGDQITVADCGGVAEHGERFKTACHCGRECSSGSEPIIVDIRPLPDAWEEARESELNAMDALKNLRDARKRREVIEHNAIKAVSD